VSFLKKNIIKESQLNAKDVGSAEVQVSLWTARIKQLSGHLQQFARDQHAKRGLQLIVNKRKKMLKYLRNKDIERFLALSKKLGLRVSKGV
jgi:small subunit ribosomal protein S15